MYAETRCIRNLQLAADDLWRIIEEVLTILPDPVGIERCRIADGRSTHLCKCSQGDIEVVVRVNAPGETPGVQQLRHTDRTIEAPEVRICEDDIAGIEAYGVIELTPVGGNHVRRYLELRRILKLAHDLTAGITGLRSTRILHIGDDIVHILAELDGLLQAPCTIRVDVDTRIREALLQCTECIHLLGALQYAALQLEVLEAVLFGQRLCLFDDSLRCQDLLTTQTEPRIRAVALIKILHLTCRNLLLIRYIEEVAEHLDFLPLLSLTEKVTHRNTEELPHQVKHRALQCPLTLYDELQLRDIQCLDALAIILCRRVRQLMDLLKNLAILRDRLSLYKRLHRIETVTGIVTTMDLTDALMSRTVLENHQISRKCRCVTARQRHQHTVITSHRNDLHLLNNRCICHFCTSFLLWCICAEKLTYPV